jgi:hypothetical protein
MISPCIEVLRRLASEVNGALGSKQGNRHATPDLTKDIKILMDSLNVTILTGKTPDSAVVTTRAGKYH